MKVKEREVDPLLVQEPGGAQASRLLRKVVLDQVNDFYDMALDVALSGEADKFEFNPQVWKTHQRHLRGGDPQWPLVQGWLVKPSIGWHERFRTN